MIGTQLDKYEVLQKIGEGGMATVYRGRHATLHREVAIKVLHPHLSSSTRNRKRFAREARAIEHLRHENILEIFDYSGVERGDCYIITEFVAGETLTEVMNRCRRMPSEIATIVGISLARALAYAHGAGILHRDLKPDNVMIREDGQVKLMDFGIARFLDESQVTLTGALVGSPAFMSPEQAREDDLDARSDLFSLGTLLFYLVTGHFPFSGSNASLILKNIIEGNRPHITELAPSMSASLADVVEQLLSVHREDRQLTAKHVLDQLLACHEELDFPAHAPAWSLAGFLDDPSAYESELEQFLHETLLAKGRALMESGEQLAALRHFNRLLSMDEDHEEALALIQDFHGVKAAGPARGRRLAWATVIGCASLGLATWWWFKTGPAEPLTRPDTRLDSREATGSTLTSPSASATPVQSMQSQASPHEPATPTPAPELPPTPEPSPIEPASPESVDRAQVAATAITRPSTERAVAITAPEPTPQPIEDAQPPSATAPAHACLGLRSLSAPADIYLDDVRLGSTRDRDCRELAPGDYTFVLRGDMIRDKRVDVTLTPGQTLDPLIVNLEYRPARIRFPVSFPDDCTVLVDEDPRGALAALDYQVMINHPEQPHTVSVDCRGRVTSVEYDALRYPNITFDQNSGR